MFLAGSDEDKTLPFIAPDDVLDVSFAMQAKRLPLDHAWLLSQALQQQLPWLPHEPCRHSYDSCSRKW